MTLEQLKVITKKTYEEYGFVKIGKYFHLDLDDIYIFSGFYKARGVLYLTSCFSIRALHEEELKIHRGKISMDFSGFDAVDDPLHLNPHSKNSLPQEIIPENYTEEGYYAALTKALHKYFDPFKIDPFTHLRKLKRNIFKNFIMTADAEKFLKSEKKNRNIIFKFLNKK